MLARILRSGRFVAIVAGLSAVGSIQEQPAVAVNSPGRDPHDETYSSVWR